MMNTDRRIPDLFSIEVRERYLDLVSRHWPGIPKPEPTELLSSWIHRLAIANGVSPFSFGSMLGLESGTSTARLDLRLPGGLTIFLSRQTGIPRKAIAAMSLDSWALKPLLLPLRFKGKRGFSTWLQYCPECLATDELPYFRSHWRLATRISCFVHGSGLRDNCPLCRKGIAPFNQRQLTPHYCCAFCGFNFRLSCKMPVTASAQRLELAIDTISRSQTGGCPALGIFIARLRRAPSLLRAFPNRPLTSLSSTARRRCFDWLGEIGGDD